MKASKVLKFIGMGLVSIGLVILVLFITMNLWNWLVPVLFHGPIISFWQTAGLVVLSKILFSGFGHRSKRHNFHNGEHPTREEWWKRFNESKKERDSTSTAD